MFAHPILQAPKRHIMMLSEPRSDRGGSKRQTVGAGENHIAEILWRRGVNCQLVISVRCVRGGTPEARLTGGPRPDWTRSSTRPTDTRRDGRSLGCPLNRMRWFWTSPPSPGMHSGHSSIGFLPPGRRPVTLPRSHHSVSSRSRLTSREDHEQRSVPRTGEAPARVVIVSSIPRVPGADPSGW